MAKEKPKAGEVFYQAARYYTEDEEAKIALIKEQDRIAKEKEDKFLSTVEKWDANCKEVVLYQSSDKAMFYFLDGQIEKIEELIFRCFTPEEISEILNVPVYKYFLWTKKTQHVLKILTAVEFSAEYRMGLSEKVLKRYIDDPNLTTQMTMLIRELSLHHSRMAGFRQPKTFGKTPDQSGQTNQVMVVTDDQMQVMLAAMREKKQAEREQVEEADIQNEEDEMFNQIEESNEQEERGRLDFEEGFNIDEL